MGVIATMTQPAPHAVVLAAGAGSRFGGEKLLAPLRGRPLIAHIAATVGEAVGTGLLSGAVAVIPPRATALASPLDTAGCTLIENPDATSGLASSLRLGLAAVTRHDPHAVAALIVLGDQPLLGRGTIVRLIDAWRASGTSVRPRYALTPEAPGHPVLLDRAVWPLAASLEGDRGMGPLFAAHPELLVTIDVPGANPDVDTAADLHALQDDS